ncbi:1,3-beta-glucan synthase component protein [Besnoitia besnoiti]|uniref:1,3-beta-glucan synthase n=1 Tax=Besnoitia besnoiti TaxID=94643 RepID=A0A2A9M7M9_BESBE|nr:1,3-beta-glucan synthase component protein [Besnoitia besnoiti]PFH31362.1 1,3-beta-glucan synthase component protein [Besnoitia besnoiti]
MAGVSPAFAHFAAASRGGSSDRRIKTNIVVVDGYNLHNSKVLDHHPPTRVGSRGNAEESPRMASEGSDDTWTERNSRCLREILTFLCRSDSRFYAEKYGVTSEDYRQQLHLYENPPELLKRPIRPYVIEQTIWFVVKRHYRFQTDSLYNQLEDVSVHLLNLCIRETPKANSVVGPDILLLALSEYHGRLFANYYKWCDYLGETPFPWQKPPWMMDSYCSDGASDSPLTDITVVRGTDTPSGPSSFFPASLRQEAQQMMYEVALFKLMWGEAANLRHTPELLCWLFHWMCMAWEPEFKAEEEFVDLIRDVVQRMRDEQWYLAGTLRAPDHGGRLLYDDINEVFWERAAVLLLHGARDATRRTEAGPDPCHFDKIADASTIEERPSPPTGPTLLFTRENFNFFVHKLLHGAKPREGVKTFMERRSYLQHVPMYLQVLRSFWRVIAWHGVTFAFLFFLRAVFDDEHAAEVSYAWNQTVVTSAVLHALGPLFDLVLLNWRALRKPHFWQFFFQENAVNLIRIVFLLIVLSIVATEGTQSPLLRWDGSVGAAYLFFYLAHGLHYYLFVRIRGQMPVFHLLWKLPVISAIAKPSTFTGNTPLLAEDFSHVVRYILFWIPVVILKTSYWLFVALPALIEAAKHIELAIARPYMGGSMTGFIDGSPGLLKAAMWSPAFLIWLFDLQIFFLLAGSLYGSLDGCWRRVGFFKSSRKIQKRLLPVLSSAPAFDVKSLLKQTKNVSNKEKHVGLSKPHPLNRGESMRRAFSRVDSVRAEAPPAPVDARTGVLNRNSTKVQYQNCKDPYRNMVPLLRTGSLANRAVDIECVDDRTIARKRFGFLWNEVVHSWRLEDIVSNAEADKLCFNELPLLSLGNGNWSLTVVDRREAFIQWNRSTFRLPVYCYCDVVLGFLKKCENFHHQISDNMARLSSKAHVAQRFFCKHLSDDPDHHDPRFEDLLHIEACTEIAEALCLYFSRYFEQGADLVDAMTDLWSWLKEDGSRLLWINLLSLKDLVPILEQLFSLLQRTGTWGDTEEADLDRCNRKLKKGLSSLVLLPSSGCDNPGAIELPGVVKEYLTAINICLGARRDQPMPSIYPQPVEIEEVNGMVREFQIIMNHTQQLHLAEEESLENDSRLMPMTAEQMAEFRCLHAILGDADADVFVGETDDRIPRGQPILDNESAASKVLLAKTEHAVKLYFRRSARILRASNPYLATAEADRRLKQFANSLLMKMPESPEIRKMISMVTLTPYYREDAALDLQDLEKPTEEGISKMELLRSLHPKEFENFLERVDREKEMFTIHQELENRVTDSQRERRHAAAEVRRQMRQSGLVQRYDRFCEALQEWASYRGQVLIRTVRGMMYHEKAIKMQAYLEETTYECLHLCHDLNRLDFGQLESIRSPEAELWSEVLQPLPVYELSTAITSTARLKYQYLVAAQEFGTDNKAKPAPAGKELTPAGRSALLRKLWVYKLLVRNPNLRIATIEAEVDERGVPTGHKLSKLYRLTADPDLLRVRVAAPTAHCQDTGQIRSRYERQMVSVPVAAARMPRPFVPVPHMPFCREEDSAPSELFSIRTRSGKKAGDTETVSASSSSAEPTHINRIPVTVNHGEIRSLTERHHRAAPQHRSPGASSSKPGAPENIQNETPKKMSCGSDKPHDNDRENDVFDSCLVQAGTVYDYGGRWGGHTRGDSDIAEHLHDAPLGDDPQRSIDNKVMNMIRKIQQRRRHDREAAERSQTFLRKMTTRESAQSLHRLSTSRITSEGDTMGAQASVRSHKDAWHLASLESTSERMVCRGAPCQTERTSAWCASHDKSCPRTGFFGHDSSVRRSDLDEGEWHFTLLERQHLRELAREPTVLLPASDSDEDGTHRQKAGDRGTVNKGASAPEETKSRAPRQGEQGLQSAPGWCGRRSSIITLHPVQPEAVGDCPTSISPSNEAQERAVVHSCCAPAKRTRNNAFQFRSEDAHASAHPAILPQELSCDHPEDQQCGVSVTPDCRGSELHHSSDRVSPARRRRSSYNGEEEPPGVCGTFASRVAMFEKLFGRRAEAPTPHRGSRKSEQSGEAVRPARRPEMVWLSRRGPLRLEAVYSVRLPLVQDEKGEPWGRYPIIGPGKPENQNHAMIFTRMETMQVVDMNMEGYLEEALKLRNLLQEFVAHPRMRILGFREHIFTENVSSLASYMALQENIFTTTNQRFYHEPLQVRMHYGHPDVFDRFFVQTCGSCSKASNGINLSEDVFAGFNCTARGYSVRHVDYMQCGKGRDVGLQQVVMFEKKIAGGNAEQMLSRDVCRMAANMDFFRLLSMYFSGPGFFFNALVLFLAAYVTLYVKCIFSFSKHKYKGVTESALQYVVAPTTYVQFQLGLLLVVPLMVWLFVEKGCWAALTRSFDIILKLAVAYYNFMIGTKASVIDHVLIYGGAKYQETGRGFVIAHATMKDLWQFYYFTHFCIGLEMMMLLFIYAIYCGFDAGLYLLDAWPLLLMALSLLFVPFLFNPLGMYYPRLLEDFSSWRKWMSSRDVRHDKASWLAWWRSEMEGRCNIAWHHQVILVMRLSRFVVLSVGIVSCVATSIKATDLDCAVCLFGTAGCLLFLMIFLDDLKLASPNWNTLLSLGLCCTVTAGLGSAVATGSVTISALLASSAAFLIFCYGLLEISFVLLGRWAVRNDVLSEAARVFHYVGGFFVFVVPVLLSIFTLSFHKIQTRILFNPNFVTIVKSGLVQRAEVMKRGHGTE